MEPIRALLFDWRGTLVRALPFEEWIAEALRAVGSDAGPNSVARVRRQLVSTSNFKDLEAPGIDSDSAWHRSTYLRIFQEAGMDRDLSEALYAVESDANFNPFADDVAPALKAFKSKHVKVGVVSDIHFDIRPAFERVGLLEWIDCFVLSYEQGVEKPHPKMFTFALEKLEAKPSETLMVGDRPEHDGASVRVGIAALLLPTLTSVHDGRMKLVEALLT